MKRPKKPEEFTYVSDWLAFDDEDEHKLSDIIKSLSNYVDRDSLTFRTRTGIAAPGIVVSFQVKTRNAYYDKELKEHYRQVNEYDKYIRQELSWVVSELEQHKREEYERKS